MTNWKARVAVLVVAMAFELSCAPGVVTVGALDVAPKLPSPRQRGRLALALAPATPDAIRIEARGFPVVEVHAAQIHFAASLRERGVEVARLVGLATAEEATASGRGSIAASLSSAVAVLHKRIAREVFVRRAALDSREEL